MIALLSISTFPNPDAATAWFESKNRQTWNYRLTSNNCMHYALFGLGAGGGGGTVYGPNPNQWAGTYTMSWSSGSYPTPLTVPIKGYQKPYPPK